jgi:predicted dehydrogenase
MDTQVRVGVIGTRGWAEMAHIAYLKKHPAVSLAAVCGRDGARAAEIAQKYAIPQVFSDYRQMIDHAGLDAVVVCSPDDLHYPMTMCALDKGLHVICEKPLAYTLSQAREMRDRAEAVGVVNMAFFTFRWVPLYLRLKQLLEEGFIGRCLSCEFHNLAGVANDTQYIWQMDPQRSNGVLGDRGVHSIDLARWLVGDITSVSARLETFLDWKTADGGKLVASNDDALLMVRFASGAHGTIHASYSAYRADHGHTQRTVFHGDQGTLVAELPLFRSESSGAFIRGARYEDKVFRDLPISENPVKDGIYRNALLSYFFDLFEQEPVGVTLFINSILAGKPVKPDFRDAVKAQEVIAAAQESQRSGKWVSL